MSITANSGPLVPAGLWKADTLHSSVGFSVKYAVARFRSAFRSFDAALDATGDQPTLSGSVDVSSLAIDEQGFLQHLMSEEFFHAERHPQVRFDSTAFRTDGDELEIDGELEIRGISRHVAATGTVGAPVEDAFGQTVLGLELSTMVNRGEFGLNWNAPLPKGGMALADEVRLEIELQLVLAH